MWHPVILCGGSGTRLWPVSRKEYPKQFVPLLDGDSLFAATLRRFRGPGFAAPVVLAQDEMRFLAAEALEAAGLRRRGAVPRTRGPQHRARRRWSRRCILRPRAPATT